ncbi:LysR family transcriptional regulator [Pseudogemmobacter faecipullorum]|uniref:LysR family transcriptional regulator n=1 Tax=Pseudogemmobacter faecipullorum TaxID=2755041 RepID=A0ABS8CND2_9RHOB|nr:LysR family transcriptional regulator [Pseudogemmobacter faecipullorum]MCB5410683.1 LysR family transcriptional regulator [Pseudogemmobacter faecipullorum]
MTLRSKLPSTGAIFMFEAAARHLSFTQAAREFNVTQPAVSRMIARLEEHLGCALFRRSAGRLELTESGKILLRGVRSGFDPIEAALGEIAALHQAENTLTISVTSAFAIHWLMPRFDKLRRDLPELTVRLDLIHGEPNGPLGAADIGLRYNMTASEDAGITLLAEEIIIPVCSPAYLHSHGLIDAPAGMEGHSIATLTGALRLPWQIALPWLGGDQLQQADEMVFSDYALVLQAAIKGQAVALGWWHVVAHEIFTGGLVPAGGRMLKTGAFYNLITRPGPGKRPAVRKLCDWLIAEFAALEAERDRLGLETVLRTGSAP